MNDINITCLPNLSCECGLGVDVSVTTWAAIRVDTASDFMTIVTISSFR